jgi:methionine sulfoxide reductase heme-binding subunit
MERSVNPHMWWYLSRSAGIVAWLMLTASVLWGIVLASDLFPKWRKSAWLLSMHRWLAGLTLFFVAGHVVTLLFDTYAKLRVVDLLVPYSSSWRPTALAIGIVALYLLIAVEGTALAMKRLSKRWWRDVHIVGYVVFWGVSIHAALAGTDASKPIYSLTAIVALSAVVFAASYRALSHHLPKRRSGGATKRSPAQPRAAENEAAGTR